MQIRQYDPEKDYEVLQKWFNDWEWAMWDKDAISPFSYIVEHEGKPIVYSSYYKTIGTNMAKMGFTVGDKNADSRLRYEATDLVLDYIFNECEEIGIKYLYYSTDVESMVRRFEEKGALITDPGDAWICYKSFGKKAEFLHDD